MAKAIVWFAKMAGANVLWLVFTLLGFVVCGIAPATVALLEVTKEIKNGEEKSMFHSFMHHYVENFVRANGYGLFIFLVNMSTLTGVYLALTYGLPIYLTALVGALAFFGFIISVFVFPAMVYFEASFINHLKIASVIALAHPTMSFVVVSVLALCYFILFQSNLIILFPIILLFFLFSIPAYFLHILMKPVLVKFSQEEGNEDPYMQLQQ